ncbi:MAG: hypothetical protein Q9214_004459 [Letrouitia sp. 1 TL-2023]
MPLRSVSPNGSDNSDFGMPSLVPGSDFPEDGFVSDEELGSTFNSEEVEHPRHLVLSMLHGPSPFSALHRFTGTELILPASNTSKALRFKAVICRSTSGCLFLESFFDRYVKDNIFDGVLYPKQLPSKPLIVTPLCGECVFETAQIARVPFSIQGHAFTPKCFIVDHLFMQREYESKFVAVLGGDFLKAYSLGVENDLDYLPILRFPSESQARGYIAYTDGSCLSNGQDQKSRDRGEPSLRAGFGVHFPNQNEWDVSLPLSPIERHTNQRAELHAAIAAIKKVLKSATAKMPIQIFSDSQYVVQGLNEHIPRWRENGYQSAKHKDVVNADLFKELDKEVSAAQDLGLPVTLTHIPRGSNNTANLLALGGAAIGTSVVEEPINVYQTGFAHLVRG